MCSFFHLKIRKDSWTKSDYSTIIKMKQWSKKLVDGCWRIEICPSHSLFLRLKTTSSKVKIECSFVLLPRLGGNLCSVKKNRYNLCNRI